MIWVVSVLLAGFGVGALVFYSSGKTQRVHQLDNYAGGHFLTAETRYQYSDNFYPGPDAPDRPLVPQEFPLARTVLVSLVDTLALAMQGLYPGMASRRWCCFVAGRVLHLAG